MIIIIIIIIIIIVLKTYSKRFISGLETMVNKINLNNNSSDLSQQFVYSNFNVKTSQILNGTTTDLSMISMIQSNSFTTKNSDNEQYLNKNILLNSLNFTCAAYYNQSSINQFIQEGLISSFFFK
jgi:hypothetical protein